uniref:Glycosyltransferase family 92 protein n=2 Tax=Caenorhabditis japonica TaxID=281687 RepID=A0A8R1DIK4_CAEJA
MHAKFIVRLERLSDLIPFKLPANLDGKPANVDHRIAIVMVVTSDTKFENYDIAIQSVRCYSRIHNYEFIVAVDTDFNCEHKDNYFRRHCVSAKILPLFDAIAFLDADIGIINPKRKIEEYMQDGIDIVFYDRFYNWEVMAGSYIAKNTQYAIDLLNEFADYEFKLPNSFHGTDNGALHIFLAEKLFPNARIQIEICQQVYNKSKDYDDLFTYEACIRAIWGTGTDFGKVRIMKKGTGWARDGWLTSMVWNEELDFMIHEWKTKQLEETPNVTIKCLRTHIGPWFQRFSSIDPWKGRRSIPKHHRSTSMFYRRTLVLRSISGANRTSNPLNTISTEQIELRFVAPDVISPLSRSPGQVLFSPFNTSFPGTGWARDGWLTSMLWHEELDFMIHEWKTEQLEETPNVTIKLNQKGRNHWYNPLGGPIHLLKCSPQNMTWSYDPRLLGDKEEILKGLEKFEKEVAMDQVNSYSRMTSMLSR